MSSKTLKVSDVVYDSLEAQKGKDETFDDVLRNVLGLTPDIEDAAAYLPDEEREIALSLIDAIDSVEEFNHEMETKGAHAYYSFVAPESGLAIVRAEFEESKHGSSLALRYRGMDGEMAYITTVSSQHPHDTEWELDIHEEYDELEEKIIETVEGAVRKWA